ncbi:glycosyltransferase family 2 protein [Magnetococcales bacterium HHB-1]
MKKLSVVIPCYNEEKTLASLIEAVLNAPRCGLDLEMIIVDDASSDRSVDIARSFVEQFDNIKLSIHETNRGKGAALRTGFQRVQGDIVLIQDADREYNPKEYPKLLEPILQGSADVVYGSRFRGGESARVLYFWHMVGNRFLTLLSNLFSNLNFTDMETCYKVFKKEIIQKVLIEEDRFGFEPEITLKISHIKPVPVIIEVGIVYHGRTYAEGKKINWKDGVSAIRCILRYGLFPYRKP